MDGFEIAGGSVPGTEHTKPGQPGWKNNQDAFLFRSAPGFIAGVVCDGCGSAEHSEFGSTLGTSLVINSLERMLSLGIDLSDQENVKRVLDHLTSSLVGDLNRVTNVVASEGRARRLFVTSHLLFTVVGFVITPETAFAFSFGDGVVAVNGEASVIPPFPDNMPPYPGYLVESFDIRPELLQFELRAHVPTSSLNSIMVGTDGVADFMEASSRLLPVSGNPLGPLSQFWEEDRYITNPDMIRRRLALANREHVEDGHVKGGLLPDDTTLVLARRV